MSHGLSFCRPSLSRCLTWGLLFPYYYPLVALQYRLPILNRFIVNNFHRIPDHALQETKHIIDTMDATLRRIYSQKLNALNSDDEDMKIRVDEGKDLMSIICTFMSLSLIRLAQTVGRRNDLIIHKAEVQRTGRDG